mgnify:CR=1 FL=1
MKHIIYLGSVCSNEELQELSGASIAGNNMQWNILNELSKYDDVVLDIYSLLSIASFPKDKKLFVKKKRKEIAAGLYVTQVPFINIPILKQITQQWSLFHYAQKSIREDSIGLSYNLYMQEGGALLHLKKKYGIKTMAILADLPIDDNYSRKGFAKILYNFFFKISKKYILDCKNIIVLNKHAIDEFAPEANYIVVNGGIDVNETSETQQRNILEKNIVYTGALTEYSGIIQLMDAIKVVRGEIVLDIYGDGPLREYVIKCASECERIKYRGKVSNLEMRKIQKKAWLLVNPRPVDDAIARVTFPSKIFEYMISGRPVLTTRHNAFDNEMLKYVYTIENNSVKSIVEAIESILSSQNEELDIRGQRAKRYVIDEFNWTVQTRKIYDFISKILDREQQ